MEAYTQDEQPQAQLESDEESFQTAPSALSYIPIEQLAKPADRGSSVDSGMGDSVAGWFGGRNSVGSLRRDRGYDSGMSSYRIVIRVLWLVHVFTKLVCAVYIIHLVSIYAQYTVH